MKHESYHDAGYAAAMARRLRVRRLILATVALLFSIVFHGFLAIKLPEYPFFADRTPRTPPPAREYPTFDVELQPEQWQRTLAEMEVLRFGGRVSDTAPDELVTIDPRPIDPVVFEPDQSPDALLPDTLQTETDLRDTAPLVELGPGQEVLRITERIAADSPDTFRRPLAPSGDRVAFAPDIVVPTTDAEFADRDPDVFSWEAVTPGTAGHLTDRQPVRAPPRATAMPESVTDIDRLTDAVVSEPIDETAGTISSIKGVDRYLAVRARKHQPSRSRSDAYIEIVIARHEDRETSSDQFLDVLPQDVFFIQDLSGSMGDRRVEACADGIGRALERLSPADRFNIITFAHEPGRYAETWLPATAQHIQAARAFAASMQAGGMTDIDAALNHILDIERDPDRSTMAVMLTDGIPTAGVTNSTRIIEEFTVRNRGLISMFAVAAAPDSIANMYLLDMLTYRNRGDARGIETGREEIAYLIDDIMRETARPVLTDLRYRFTRASQCDAYPVLLSDLYLDRPLVIYGKLPANRPVFAFQVIGRVGDRLYDFVFELNLDEMPEADESIRRQWARHRIYSLIGEHMRTEDSRTLRELFDTANRYGLEIPYLDDFSRPSRLPWR